MSSAPRGKVTPYAFSRATRRKSGDVNLAVGNGRRSELTVQSEIIPRWRLSTISMSFFMLLASRLPEQREQSSRHHSHNGVRFFADCAAKKGLLSEQQKSGLKDIGSVLPLTPQKCG